MYDRALTYRFNEVYIEGDFIDTPNTKPNIELWEDLATPRYLMRSLIERSQMRTYRKLMISLIKKNLTITSTYNSRWIGKKMDLSFQESTRY